MPYNIKMIIKKLVNNYNFDKNVCRKVNCLGKSKKLPLVARLSNYYIKKINKLPNSEHNYFKVTFVGETNQYYFYYVAHCLKKKPFASIKIIMSNLRQIHTKAFKTRSNWQIVNCKNVRPSSRNLKISLKTSKFLKKVRK